MQANRPLKAAFPSRLSDTVFQANLLAQRWKKQDLGRRFCGEIALLNLFKYSVS